MTVDDYPVRPEMRLVEAHEIGSFSVFIFEQPDIAVDEPYFVVMRSNDARYGLKSSRQPFTTLMGAREQRDAELKQYLNHPGNEQLREAVLGVYKEKGIAINV